MSKEFRDWALQEEKRTYDRFAHAVTVIDEPHRMGHDGFVHHVSGKVTGILNLGVQDFLMVTGAFNFPHLQRVSFTTGRGDIDIHSSESAVTSNDGTLQDPFNTNRNSAITPAMGVYIDPTVTNVGTLIHTAWVEPTSAGVGQSAQGVAGTTSGEEWILAPTTKYLIRVTNNSGATIDMRYEFFWYEIGYDK